VNVRIVRRMLHSSLHYHAIKIQLAQKLSERDEACRVQFYNQFLDSVQETPGILNALLMSDEAHFHLTVMWANKFFVIWLQRTVFTVVDALS
jgi:hypothetical protein